MPWLLSDLPGVFLLGAATGSTLCTFSCLGYLGPLLLGDGRGFKDGIARGLFFIGGKVLCYSGLAAIAGALGRQFSIPTRDAALLMAASLAWLAVSLFLPRKRCMANCGQSAAGRWPIAGLGMMSGLIPCPALLGLLGMAAASGNSLTGGMHGLTFGLGLLVSPLVPAAAGLGHLGARLREEIARFAPCLRLACAALLVAGGIRMLLTL